MIPHTPPPYEVGGPHPSVSVIVCTDPGVTYPPDAAYPPEYDTVCILDNRIHGEPCPQALANVAFIVRACNAHDGLVEVCQRFVQDRQCAQKCDGSHADCCCLFCDMSRALAKAAGDAQ